MSGRDTFRAWLRDQTDRDDPIGDFARDAQYDRFMPSANTTRRAIRYHLESMGSDPLALEAFEKAWREWANADRGEPWRIDAILRTFEGPNLPRPNDSIPLTRDAPRLVSEPRSTTESYEIIGIVEAACELAAEVRRLRKLIEGSLR